MPETASPANDDVPPQEEEEDKHEERTFSNIINAIVAFEAAGALQLSVLEGDKVEIFQQHESGWTFGRKVKSGSAAPAVEGWFPTWVVKGREGHF